VQEIVKTLFGKEPHKGVNPDEVVAVGAAIQGGVLAGEVKDILLLDVTPLSLGIETLGGIMTKLVERNTTIPAERKNVFSTADDNQNAVTVKVYQGERSMASDNRLLGQFNLEGIPPAPRGVPQIEVKFDIDQNGILHVSAKDLGTGKEQTVRIEQSAGLSEDEIERRRKEADSHAEEDKKKRTLAEARNQADTMTWQLEKLLQEHDAKLSAADKEAVTKSIERTRAAAKGDDAEAIKAALRELEQASHALSKTLYAQAGPQPGAAAGEPGPKPGSGQPGGSGGDDDAIDAEFEVKK
jgi:molecular chaperone DnaK